MRIGRLIVCLVISSAALSAQERRSSDPRDYMQDSAHAVMLYATAVLAADHVTWKKINTEEVNSAIDDFRSTVIAVESRKSSLREEIHNEQIDSIRQLRNSLSFIDAGVVGLANVMGRIDVKIWSAIDSNYYDRHFRKAAEELKRADDELRGNIPAFPDLPAVWSESHESAAEQLSAGTKNSEEIVRALNCVQTTIKTGKIPLEECRMSDSGI